jgi:lactate dehydrogenase-like 2-hydroxyacid dehydrogenase
MDHLLQLCPMTSGLEAALSERFTVHRLFDEKNPEAFLRDKAHAIRGVVTGGHLGLPSELSRQLPALEIVAINGVGFDKVDLEEAKRRGYRVTNTPDVLTDDVADLAIGLIIGLLRQVARGDAHIRSGRWPSADLGLSSKVSRRRYGVYGLGRIGAAIAKRLSAFDASIAYSNRSRRDVPYDFYETPRDLAANCNVLVVAVGASEQTRNTIDAEVLDALGPNGFLINVGRGSVVDEPALVQALRDGRIAGAALDVFAHEPHVPEALFGLPNVLMTPHIGTATRETRQDMADLVLANLDAHFAGRTLPTAVV